MKQMPGVCPGEMLAVGIDSHINVVKVLIHKYKTRLVLNVKKILNEIKFGHKCNKPVITLTVGPNVEASNVITVPKFNKEPKRKMASLLNVT